MYSRTDLRTNDEHRGTKPRKKYELSLKNIKNNVKSERNAPLKQDKPERPNACNKREESTDSENFRLRLSESFAIDDTYDDAKAKVAKVMETKEMEVIVIGDSSDEGTPEKFDRMKYKSLASSGCGIRKSTSAPNCVYTIKSSDSEDSDERYGRGSSKAGSIDVPVKELQRKCSIVYTSDEDISEDESGIKSCKRENIFYRNRDDEGISRVTSVAKKMVQENEKKLISSSERLGGHFNDKDYVESELGFNSDKRQNVFYRINDKEDKSRTTPAATRNDEYFRKNCISSSEKIRKKINDESNAVTEPEMSGNKRGNIFTGGNDKENKLRITPTATKNCRDSEKKLFSSSEKLRGILTDSGCNIDSHGSTKSLKETDRRVEEEKRTPVITKALPRTPATTDTNRNPEEARRTPISAKLTRKDARQILKVIKSKKAVYESPKVWKKPRCSDDSDIDESRSENSSPEPMIKPKENIAAGDAILIDESESETDEKVIQGSRVDSSKPYKTHVTRFLEPTIGDDYYGGLSEKKKMEVAKWLLTNSVDSRSDSSVSNISGTQGNSPNSGNSSLERLEQNYETPNNRGKIKKIDSTEKTTNAPNSTRSVKSVRQTTIDDFVMKTKDGGHSVFTPVNATTSKRRDLVNPAVSENIETLGIMDCADILDNLYGTVWRERANDLLPSSEPRRANVVRKDKGVQTERKVNPRSKNIVKKSSASSSQDDEFDAFVRNIRPNLNSTKKSATATSRRRCSFIRDSPSSVESGGETTYLTALTNPRISDNRKITNRVTPASLAIQRARAICDSDTEDENDKGQDYRKQLSFSDDDNSSTSEYDPNDVIPPKTATKTLDALKTPRDVYKSSKSQVPKVRVEKTKSFLTSLSATVPLNEAHPDARKYRQYYKTTKEELCKYLYKLFNEKAFDNKLPNDMSVEWNVRMRGTAGYCYNKRSIKALGGITRSSRIVLATKILDTPDRLRDTLIHEMCHAAAWLINEVSDGHGPFWKGWASKAMRVFPELPPIQRCHDYKITTKFTYRCTGCGYSVGRHSKSLDTEKKRCGHCYGKFELLMNKVTKSGTVQVQTPKAKQPTGFALFVKENYHSVKKDRKGVAHKEVMQILGQQFSAIKITKKPNNFDDNNSDTASKN